MMNRTLVFLVLAFMTASCFVGIGAVSGSGNEASDVIFTTETAIATEATTTAPGVSILSTHTPIRINSDGEFATTATAEGWSGSGAAGNPYIIQNYDINGSGYGYCIYIGNTTVNFVIWNCTLHNAAGSSGAYYWETGLVLDHVGDAKVVNVTAYANKGSGIRANYCDTPYICNSTVYNNKKNGIYDYYSQYGEYNNITAYGNNNPIAGYAGIFLDQCEYPLITKSYIHNNPESGIKINSVYKFTLSYNEIVHNCGGVRGLFVGGGSLGHVFNNNVSSSTGSGIEVFSSEVYIYNNNISDNNLGSSGQAAIYLSGTSNCLIENNTFIKNHCDAMYLDSSPNTIIQKNFIEGTYNYMSIHIISSAGVLVKQNNITKDGYGIYGTSSPSMIIEYNWIYGHSNRGIELGSSSNDAIIRYNWVHDNSLAINIYSSSNVEIHRNILYDYSSFDIQLSNNANNNRIHNNTVLGSKWNWNYLIYLSQSNMNIVQNNTINGVCGIAMESSSSQNTIHMNSITVTDTGIYLGNTCQNNRLMNNKVNSSYQCIYLYYADLNLITDNTLGSPYLGIYLQESQSVTIRSNTMSKGGIFVIGSVSNSWTTHTIPTTNMINGKPVRYLSSQVGGTVAAGAGQIILASCSGVTVQGQGLNDTTVGIEIGFCSNINVNKVYCDDSKLYGVYVYESTFIKIGNFSADRGKNDGLYIYNTHDIEIDNCSFDKNSNYAAEISSSYNGKITKSTFDDNYLGITLSYSSHINIIGNYIRRNAYDGFNLYYCQDFVIKNNVMLNDDIYLWGGGDADWDTNIISTSNTVNGRPIWFYCYNASINVPSNAGEVILYKTTDIRMKDLNLSDADYGILSLYTIDTLVDGCDMSKNDRYGAYFDLDVGLVLKDSNMSDCGDDGLYYYGELAKIDNNTASNNEDYGFEVYWKDIVVTNNVALNNQEEGMYLGLEDSLILDNIAGRNNYSGIYLDVYRCKVEGNVVYQNIENGFYLESPSDILFDRNIIMDNDIYGVYISSMQRSVLRNNTFSYNPIGIYLDSSQHNDIYWNNFIDNGLSAIDYDDGGNDWSNRWNATYPLGGNYYSEYTGVDVMNGAKQDQAGPDGFGDTPYEIGSSSNATDWAPLMEPAQNGLPLSNVVLPAVYWYTNKATLAINAVDADGIASVDLYCRFSPDNATWDNWFYYTTLDQAPYAIDAMLIGGEGYYQFKSQARDLFGNPELSKTGFDAEVASDLTAPVVGITGPAENYLTSSAAIVVNWTASDAMSGVAGFQVKVDGGAWADINTTIGHTFTNLTHGAHELYVMAIDAVGNNATDSVSVFVDLTPPSSWIIEPYDGAFYNSPNVFLQWSASDHMSGILRTDIKVDSDPWHSIVGNTADTLTGLSEGQHTVYIRAFDNAGNTLEDSATFTVDLTAPKMNITSPANDAMLTGWYVDMTWNATDALSGIASVALSLDGWAWRGIGNSSGYQVSYLTDGPHTVDVMVYDGAGNTKTASINFTIDNKAPAVSVSWPSATYINSTDVTVVYSASEANGIIGYALKMDSDAAIATGDLSHAFTNLSEGSHSVTVTATDAAGNAGNTTVIFNVDTTAPVISINLPAAGETTQKAITAEWDATDTSGIESYEVNMDDGDWINAWLSTTWTFTGLSLGGHTFTVKTTDLAGNTAEKSVDFEIVESVTPSDTTIPKITGFTPSGETVQPSIDVSVFFDEAMDPASIKYTCTPDPSGWSAFWSADGKTLVLTHTAFAYATNYTFAITQASDLAGNDVNGTATYTFKTVVETTGGGGGGGGDTGDQKSSTLPWILVIILAVIVLILIVVAVILSRKRSEPEPAKSQEKPSEKAAETEEETAEVVDEEDEVVEAPGPEDMETEDGAVPEPAVDGEEPEIEEDADIEEVEDDDITPPPPPDNDMSLKLDLSKTKEAKTKK